MRTHSQNPTSYSQRPARSKLYRTDQVALSVVLARWRITSNSILLRLAVSAAAEVAVAAAAMCRLSRLRRSRRRLRCCTRWSSLVLGMWLSAATTCIRSCCSAARIALRRRRNCHLYVRSGSARGKGGSSSAVQLRLSRAGKGTYIARYTDSSRRSPGYNRSSSHWDSTSSALRCLSKISGR